MDKSLIKLAVGRSVTKSGTWLNRESVLSVAIVNEYMRLKLVTCDDWATLKGVFTDGKPKNNCTSFSTRTHLSGLTSSNVKFRMYWKPLKLQLNERLMISLVAALSSKTKFMPEKF